MDLRSLRLLISVDLRPPRPFHPRRQSTFLSRTLYGMPVSSVPSPSVLRIHPHVRHHTIFQCPVLDLFLTRLGIPPCRFIPEVSLNQCPALSLQIVVLGTS